MQEAVSNSGQVRARSHWPVLTMKKDDSQVNFDLMRFREEILALAVQANRCPKCDDNPFLVSKDLTKVCPECGWVVAEDFLEDDTIPFEEEGVSSGHSEGTYNPGGLLSDGGGLGMDQSKPDGKIASRLSFSVLGKHVDKPIKIKCPHCKTTFEMNDLPLRAQQTTVIVEKYEHPRLQGLLRLGRKRIKMWGVESWSNAKKATYKNQYGQIVRVVAERLINRNLRVSPSQVVDACWLLTLKVLEGQSSYFAAREKVVVDDRILKDATILWEETGGEE